MSTLGKSHSKSKSPDSRNPLKSRFDDVEMKISPLAKEDNKPKEKAKEKEKNMQNGKRYGILKDVSLIVVKNAYLSFVGPVRLTVFL